MKHYSYSKLDAFHHGSLGKLSSILCRLHLKKCEECQKIYQQVIEDESLITELRQSYHDFDAENLHSTPSTI